MSVNQPANPWPAFFPPAAEGQRHLPHEENDFTPLHVDCTALSFHHRRLCLEKLYLFSSPHTHSTASVAPLPPFVVRSSSCLRLFTPSPLSYSLPLLLFLLLPACPNTEAVSLPPPPPLNDATISHASTMAMEWVSSSYIRWVRERRANWAWMGGQKDLSQMLTCVVHTQTGGRTMKWDSRRVKPLAALLCTMSVLVMHSSCKEVRHGAPKSLSLS